MAFEWVNDKGECLRLDDEGLLWKRGPDLDAEMVLADDADAYSGLEEAVSAMETYRRALEPFARALASAGSLFPEIPWGKEEDKALREACKLMGYEV